MSTVDNKELELLEAIDNYDLYSPGCRRVLKTLVKLAIDGVAVVNIKNLSKMSNLSVSMVYIALKLLQDAKLIELPGARVTSCVLKPLKLNEILKYYKKQQEVIKQLENN